jgi:hypothetical protein
VLNRRRGAAAGGGAAPHCQGSAPHAFLPAAAQQQAQDHARTHGRTRGGRAAQQPSVGGGRRPGQQPEVDHSARGSGRRGRPGKRAIHARWQPAPGLRRRHSGEVSRPCNLRACWTACIWGATAAVLHGWEASYYPLSAFLLADSSHPLRSWHAGAAPASWPAASGTLGAGPTCGAPGARSPTAAPACRTACSAPEHRRHVACCCCCGSCAAGRLPCACIGLAGHLPCPFALRLHRFLHSTRPPAAACRTTPAGPASCVSCCGRCGSAQKSRLGQPTLSSLPSCR